MSKYQKMLNRAELAGQLAAATVLLHVADGIPIAEIVVLTGYRPRSIRQIVQRYLETGAESVVDRRTLAQGATPLLSAEERRELHQALQHPPPNGGAWTGPKVAAWMAAKTGRPVHRQRGWEYLRQWQRHQAGA